MRFSSENIMKDGKNKDKRRLRKCLKTVLSNLITIVAIHESCGQFQEMIFTLQTASYIAEKYVKGTDELKKYIIRVTQEAKLKLSNYLHDFSDLGYIAVNGLEQELFELREAIKESDCGKRDDDLKRMNNELYDLFQYKLLNRSQYVLLSKEEEAHEPA